MIDDESGLTTALNRLQRLHMEGVLTAAEDRVAREAMLGAMKDVSEGRSRRIRAYEALRRSSDSRNGDASERDRTRIPAITPARFLGLAYGTAPARWDGFLAILEHVGRVWQEEQLSHDQSITIKYGAMGRLNWLALVGNLLWLERDHHSVGGWCREDGWFVSRRTVDHLLGHLMDGTPREKSPMRDDHVHEYIDWIHGQCWRHFDRVIARGDARYLRHEGVLRADDAAWPP